MPEVSLQLGRRPVFFHKLKVLFFLENYNCKSWHLYRKERMILVIHRLKQIKINRHIEPFLFKFLLHLFDINRVQNVIVLPKHIFDSLNTLGTEVVNFIQFNIYKLFRSVL